MFAHSVGKNTWLTKLERIGKLASNDKKMVFNNIGHILDIRMLRNMYQQISGKKAVGIDGVTKEEYGKNLESNLKDLLRRIRKGAYKPKASRVVEIPKEDGSTRPLAIACFEDKLVQAAVNKILCTIFEPLFLPYSFGFRPNHDCHEALRAMIQNTDRHQDGAIVEIDIQKYFNTIPHRTLNECLRKRISDNRFIRLINTLITAPVMVEGKGLANTIGCPQGSSISPILSNIYLHYVIDVWFSEIGRTHMRGDAREVRYADDMVFFFQRKDDAERFYKVLPKRLEKFGLELQPNKSQVIESGKKAAAKASKRGEKLKVYQFLGFTCYWGKARAGFWRLKFSSRSDRFSSTLRKFRDKLWENLNTKDITRLLEWAVKFVQGWINYHAISDNGRRVMAFIRRCKQTLFRWFNRRGGRRRMRWDRLACILKEVNFPERWKTQSLFSTLPKQA